METVTPPRPRALDLDIPGWKGWEAPYGGYYYALRDLQTPDRYYRVGVQDVVGAYSVEELREEIARQDSRLQEIIKGVIALPCLD